MAVTHLEQLRWLDPDRKVRATAKSTDEHRVVLAFANPELGEAGPKLVSVAGIMGEKASESFFGGDRWSSCLSGECGDLTRAIRSTPFALAMFLKHCLQRDHAAAIVAGLAHQRLSLPFKLTQEHQLRLQRADGATIFNAIRAASPDWNGGPKGPSTRQLIKAVLKSLRSARRSV